MNTPSLIEETTRLRMELLGASFTAQHSDARVIDQIIYKWDHSREAIGKVLIEKYTDLEMTGWQVASHEIERDVKELFGPCKGRRESRPLWRSKEPTPQAAGH